MTTFGIKIKINVVLLKNFNEDEIISLISWSAKNDFNCWSNHIVPGGILAIHDVFPNPQDGGRPPFEIFCAAKESNKFVEIEMIESLAILEKI